MGHNIPTTITTAKATTEMAQYDTSNPSIPLNLVYQLRNGANSTTTLVCGAVPDPHVVAEHGLQYYVKVLQNQNHGFFLDMAPGRAWVQHNAKDCRVLDLFAYTCAFSVAAMAGGATEVIDIDMAGGALQTGQRNHDLNQNRFPSSSSSTSSSSSSSSMTTRFLAHDIFKSWGKLTRLGP
jgi:23S rRNA (cytosine1962-C5)-methyltransferase